MVTAIVTIWLSCYAVNAPLTYVDIPLARVTIVKGHEQDAPAAIDKVARPIVVPPNCELRYSAEWKKP